MTKELLKLALEALENTTPTWFNMERDKQFFEAITAIKEDLAQPVQEPVGHVGEIDIDEDGQAHAWFTIEQDGLTLDQPLYTTPPAAQRKPLTDEQHEQMMRGLSTLDYGRAVEAYHGIKEQV